MKKYDDIKSSRVFIIMKRKITNDSKSYLRIIGIDIKTNKLVVIVDNNGDIYNGYHSYNGTINRIEEFSVIEAKFVPAGVKCKLDETKKIVSDFKIIATGGNLYDYWVKTRTMSSFYKALNDFGDFCNGITLSYTEKLNDWMNDIPESYPELLSLHQLDSYININDWRECYMLIDAINMQTQGRHLIYGNYLFNLSDSSIKKNEKNQMFYSGIALVRFFKEDDVFIFDIEKIYGDFLNEPIKQNTLELEILKKFPSPPRQPSVEEIHESAYDEEDYLEDNHDVNEWSEYDLDDPEYMENLYFALEPLDTQKGAECLSEYNPIIGLYLEEFEEYANQYIKYKYNLEDNKYATNYETIKSKKSNYSDSMEDMEVTDIDEDILLEILESEVMK